MSLRSKREARLAVMGLPAVAVLGLALSLPPRPVSAQAPPEAGGEIIVAPSQVSRFRIAVFDGGGADGPTSATVAARDFALAGNFQVLVPASFSHLKGEPFASADPTNWRSVGAQGISKGRSTGSAMEFKLFLTHKGAVA